MHYLAMVSEGFLYTDQDSSKLQKKDGEVKTNVLMAKKLKTPD